MGSQSMGRKMILFSILSYEKIEIIAQNTLESLGTYGLKEYMCFPIK